jgi:hypothetical protein
MDQDAAKQGRNGGGMGESGSNNQPLVLLKKGEPTTFLTVCRMLGLVSGA